VTIAKITFQGRVFRASSLRPYPVADRRHQSSELKNGISFHRTFILDLSPTRSTHCLRTIRVRDVVSPRGSSYRYGSRTLIAVRLPV
jgi:hypothetical protein